MLDHLHRAIAVGERALVIGAALCCFHCAASRPPAEDQGRAEARKTDKRPLGEYEATLKPSDYDQDVEAVAQPRPDEPARAQLELPKDSVFVQEDVIQGFRVQIYSSASIDDAAQMKIIAMDKFREDSVYVVYDAPVYKVRVGDFANRYEANQILSEFIDKGFRDAWIVPDRIVQRKVVTIPRPGH